MPAKQDWVQYFNKLNKTLNNFELRLERLEGKVASLSKGTGKTQAPSAEDSSPVSAKRKTGWILFWISIALFVSPILGFFGLNFVGYIPYRTLISLALFVVGLVMIVSSSSSEKPAEKTSRKTDLGEESIFMPEKEEKASRKALASPAKTVAKQPKSNFEADIGKKWLPKIGIISIVLGIAFFVILAIQNKWIGPTGQVALGVLAGIGVIVAGEVFFRKNYRNYGMTLVGGGFAIVYFSMFAAYKFYKEAIGISLIADMVSLSFIIAAAVYFSIRYDSVIIAAEAFFLGYLVPMLTTYVDTFFLMYAIVLTLGIAALTYFRNWKFLGAGGMAAMYLTHLFWLDYYSGANKSWLHLIFLLVYFAVFAFMAINLKEGAKNAIDSWIGPRNAFAALFLVTYVFLFQLDFSNFMIVIIPLVLLLILLAFFVMKFKWDYFVIGGILLTYLLHWKWFDMNFNQSSLLMNFIASSVYFALVSVLTFFLSDSRNKTGNVLGILLNSLFYFGLNAYPLYRLGTPYEGLFTAMLAIIYLVLAYLAYARKIAHYFSTYLILCFGYLTLAVPLQFNREWITISWAVLTLILVILSFRLKENVIRISGSVVAGLTLLRVLFYDSWKLNPVDLSNFLGSTRLFAFLAAIIVFYTIAYVYYKNKDMFDDYKDYIMYVNAVYAIAATLLVTVLIWLEISGSSLSTNQKDLWISIGIILQAIVMLAIGFAGKIKLFRMMGLILFGLAIVKVFLYDLRYLEKAYRVVSFIVLGVIALFGAFLYNKFRDYI